MAAYKNENLRKAFTAMKNQQKLYFSGCCRSNNYLEAAETAINGILLRVMEDLAVDDIMNGGQHDIKNIGPDNRFPILAIDNMIFCNYQTAKKMNALSTMGCPIEGNYNSIDEGKRMLGMISDLRNGTVEDFVRKYYTEGEYYNGAARLISMLERLYNTESFSDEKYSKTEFYGEAKFDSRAMVAAMQFINANTNNAARYENSVLYYANAEIKAVGAQLSFKRGSVSEDFVLSGITLKLYADEQRSRYIPFVIAVGASEREAAKSFGRMFTADTYPKYQDKATNNVPFASFKIPAWQIHQKACGGPDDKRTLKQFFEDYAKVDKETSTISFAVKIANRTASDDDIELGLINRDYVNFIKEWRNALDFVQYTTLPYTLFPLDPDQKKQYSGYRIVSLFETKEEYVEYLAKLSGGLNADMCAALRKRAQYPEMIEPAEDLTYSAFKKASEFAMSCFSDELNSYCRQTDIYNTVTVSEIQELIESTKRITVETLNGEELDYDNLLPECYAAVDYAIAAEIGNCLL